MTMLASFIVAQQGSPMGSSLTLLMPLIIIVIFYFLVILPTRKRQKKVEAMIHSLKLGDRVITTGGIYGTVDRIKETTLMLKVADQVKLEIAKSAVVALQSQPEESK